MLSEAMVAPTLPIVDMGRAKKFYVDTLGLKVMREDKGGLMLSAGAGTGLYLYPRSATKADHTVASFNVKDIVMEMKDFRAKGVKFEEIDISEMHIKTVDGLAMGDGYKMAWFKDTEGNILSLVQM